MYRWVAASPDTRAGPLPECYPPIEDAAATDTRTTYRPATVRGLSSLRPSGPGAEPDVERPVAVRTDPVTAMGSSGSIRTGGPPENADSQRLFAFRKWELSPHYLPFVYTSFTVLAPRAA